MTAQPNGNKTEPEIRHQREFVWQILLPFIAAVLALLFIAILSISTAGITPAVNEKWAQISTILLLLPTLLFGLVILALVIILIWLLRKLARNIPTYTGFIFQLSCRTAGITNNIAAHSAEPFIRLRSIFAGLTQLITLAFHNKTNHKE